MAPPTLSYQSQKPSLGFPGFPFPSVHICPSVTVLSLSHLSFSSNSPPTYLLNPSSSVSLISSLVQATVVCYIETRHSENGLEGSSIDSRLSRGCSDKESTCHCRRYTRHGFSPLEKEMATHSSILAWEIPWTEEPGRIQSMGSQESDRTRGLNHHHRPI